jgi:hypothetical protein
MPMTLVLLMVFETQSRWRLASYSAAFGKPGVTWSSNATAVLRRHPLPAFRALNLYVYFEDDAAWTC